MISRTIIRKFAAASSAGTATAAVAGVATAAAGSSTGPSFWSRLGSIPSTYPFYFGVGLSTVKTSFSDFLVQKVVERKEEVDWKRNAAFAAFGFFYLGGVQYAIYVPLFGRMFPHAAAFAAKPLRAKLSDGRGMLQLVWQVLLDQVVHHPLMYFPAFYCTKELVLRPDKPNFKQALIDYSHNIREDLVALWKVWLPGTVLNFAFMPMWARIPFVAGVSLLWTCILSTMRGGDVAHGEEIAGGAVTGATFHILEESFEDMFTCPVELDREKMHIVLTASGPDSRGLVATLAREVAKQGGNVTHSNMVRLGSEFIILMHVAVPPEQHREFMAAIDKSKELTPLHIHANMLTRRETGKYDKAVMGLRLHAVGEDRPGMLASISEKLQSRGLNIENVSTELRRNKTGRRDFVCNVNCTTTSMADKHNVQGLVHDISELRSSLELDVLDVRVARDNRSE